MHHVMSITKAAIGLMYHLHRVDFPREAKLQIGDEQFDTGLLLNMATGHTDEQWDYDQYRMQVESDKHLGAYANRQLGQAKKARLWKYNNLIYQLLASNMRGVASLFGLFMGDEAGPLVREEEEWKNSKGELEKHITYFRHGKEWKWEHTESGEPLGPHGLWLTPSSARKFGERTQTYLREADRVDVGGGGWKPPSQTKSKLHSYWNGWWFSDQCAYAIGYVCQTIAITPLGVRVQIYEEDWDNPLEKNPGDPKWSFIDKIEAEFPKHAASALSQRTNFKSLLQTLSQTWQRDVMVEPDPLMERASVNSIPDRLELMRLAHAASVKYAACAQELRNQINLRERHTSSKKQRVMEVLSKYRSKVNI